MCLSRFVSCIMALCVPVIGFGLGLDVEFYHTEMDWKGEGHFAVVAYPSTDSTPAEVQDVFVRAYPSADHREWAPLLSFIRRAGGRVIAPSEVGEFSDANNARVFNLGGGGAGQATFLPEDKDSLIDTFVEWSLEYAPQVYANQILANWGPGILEVERLDGAELTSHGVMWIGRFHQKEAKATLKATAQGTTTVERLTMDFTDPRTLPPKGGIDLEQHWRDSRFDEAYFLYWWKVLWQWFVAGIALIVIVRLVYQSRHKDFISDGLLERAREEVPLREHK